MVWEEEPRAIARWLLASSRLSLPIAGTEWLLHWWVWDEPVPAGIDMTFSLDADLVNGRAACSRYFSAASEGPYLVTSPLD